MHPEPNGESARTIEQIEVRAAAVLEAERERLARRLGREVI